ncbi:VCBS domain-containing protein [Vibrio sp. SCSIO 43136]|uniref:VCBS domain-containing protein n=1 Tax=Vibrio sp. SCSIO 43136 TaxID=2819101 RepID=UPI002074B72C|nr:VCBS domain-containing protein [Vibrio sp. SCSIO 43136]
MDSVVSLLNMAIAGTGQVIVIDANGNLKVVPEGTPLQPGEVIVTNDSGEQLESDVPTASFVNDDLSLTELDLDNEIDQIFAALEDGQDPTQLGDDFATAAGGTGSGSSLTPVGSVDRTAAESQPETFFDTTGLESQGLSETQSLTLLEAFRVILNNEAPTAVNDTAQVDEDGSVTIDVLANDTDPEGEELTIIAADVISGQGTVEIVDGQLVFTPDENFNGDVELSYTVSDGTNTDTATVSVVVNPVNDPAIVTPTEEGSDTGNVQEDVTLSTSGSLDVSDVDSGESLFVEQTNVPDGNWGFFSIDVEGEWTYTLNNDHPDVQALDADSDPVNRTITVTTADGTTFDVVVTITGTDDQAVITPNTDGDDVGSVQEDVTLSTSGNLDVVDPDAGEAVFVEQTNVADGDWGFFSIDETGEWTYTLNNSHPDVQALDADSNPVTREITVASADGTEHTVTITITGSDDTAIITPNTEGDDAGAVQEDVTLSTSGNLDVVDPDAGEAVFVEQTNVADGDWGFFTIDETGEWTYTLNNAHPDVQALDADSDPVMREITVASADGTEHTVTITITGSDDTAIITPNTEGDDAGAVQEDVTLSTSGNLDVVDPDAGEAVFVEQTNVADGDWGFFSIDETGEWTYTLNNAHPAVQALDADSDPVTREITVASADGTEHTVTITITGSDDTAIITPNTEGDDAGAVQEDVTLSTSGNLDVVDPDAGEAVFVEQTNVADGDWGFFSIDETGEWTYTLNNAHPAVQALDADSDPVTREITVASADGTEHTVTITITGSDDTAIITPNTEGDDAGAVQEDVTLSASGNLDVVDPDAGEAVFVEQTNVADGDWGFFTIDETGEWTYTLNNAHPDVQALDADSDPVTREITVASADGTEHTVTITITGSDDTAIITPNTEGDDAGAVQEDVTLSTSGNLDVVDPDAGEAVFVEQTNVADGDWGFFTIDETGEWTYTLNNSHPDVQALDADSDPVTREITVASADGTEHTVTITITGSDDTAIITPNTEGDDAGTVQEDVTLSTNGNLDVVDPDAGEAVFVEQTNVADGDWGFFTIDETGEWTYTLNNAHPDVQALDADSDPVTREITVASADGTEHTVTITITGSDDTAIITPNTEGDDAGAVQEDVTLSASGNLDVVDPDAGEAVFVEQTNVADGDWGFFTIDETGEWTYTLNNSHPDVQALDADSDPVTREITVASADGTEHTVTITITGSDDKAIITPNTEGDDAGAVQEDVTLSTSGNLDVVDPDAGEAVFVEQTNVADGDWGFFTIDETGEWTYTLNNAHPDVQALDADSDPVTREITVASADGTEHTVTITITGSDDTAIITPNTEGDDAGAVQEDVTLSTSGNLDVVDPDAGEAVFVEQTNVADGDWGFFTIDATGEWTYTLNNAHPDVQALDADSDPVTREITVASADGTEHTVTITITGSDDKAIITPNTEGDDAGAVQEDVTLSTSGNLDVVDPDAGEAVFVEQTNVADGDWGFFTIDETGEWTYTLNNSHPDVQALDADSNPVTREITVASADGTEHTVTITITGSDDTAIITPNTEGDDAGAVQEDVTLSTSGNLDVVDPDAGEAVFVEQTNVADGDWGFFTIDETGEWTYTLNNSHPDVQALDADSDPVTREITVASADGTEHTVTIIITGSDDKAIITPNTEGDDAGAVQEDVTLSTSGNLDVVDPDAGEAVFVEQTNVADGDWGFFTIDETGEWTYTLNNSHPDVQALDADSDPVTREITVASADGTEHTVTITITGSDDKAIITPNTEGDDAGAVQEDVTLSTSGNLDVVDPDAGEAVFVEQTNVADGDWGFFTIDETGEWTYTLNNSHPDVQALDADSDPVTREITVASADGTEHTVTITITGSDDKAIITPNTEGDDTGAVQEDVTLSTSGNLDVVDPDAGEAVFVEQTNVADGDWGFFTIDETGEWTYTLNNSHPDVQALDADSDPVTREITVASADGTEHTVTITITGSDDKAIITPNTEGDDAGAVQEDVTLSTSGNLDVVDPDAGEAVFVEQTNVADGDWGFFTIDETGEWTYTLNNAHPDVQALDADSDPVTREITVASADGTEHTVTITITGSDDTAIITPNTEGDDAGAVQEDVTLSTSGNLDVVDPDAGEAVFVEQTNVADGDWGFFTIDETGEWTYTLNNAHPDVQALDADSDPVTREITVASADGTEHTVTITITGSDDTAIITPNTEGDDAGAVQEDVTLSTSGNLDVVDPDAGEAVFVEQTNVADGDWGFFTIDATGEWTYTLNNAHPDVQALDADSDPVTREITVASADGTEHTVTITITGSDDKAIITPNTEGDDAGAVQEDVTLSTSGNLDVVDPDAGEAVFVEQTNVADGDWGFFTIDETGEWTYTLNNSHPDVQALDADSNPVTREITVASADGTEHTVTITITGSDDTAIITPNTEGDDAGAVQEDVTLSTSGNLDVVDPDAGEAVFVEQTNVADGDWGFFTIDETGEWTYTLNNSHPDVQALDADSDPVTREITVASADGTEHTVTITITGSDDKAIITPNTEGDDVGAVQEDVTLSTSGNLDVVDPDAGEAVFVEQTNVADGDWGFFTIDETGEWTYTLNNSHPDVQALDADSDPVTREITVASADGTEHTVTITITGSDDKAIITPNTEGDDAGAVQEDVTLSTSGNLDVVDPDAGEAVFIEQTNVADGDWGFFTIDETGEWTYTLNNAHPDVQALDADSDPVTREITVASADGTEHTVTITITGSDDTAIITPNTEGDDAGAVQEDVTLSTSGNLDVVDPDAGEAVFVEQTNVADGDWGFFTIDETGEWTYTLNNSHPDVQALDADSDSVTREIAVASADGTEHTVTITITGSDDTAIITPNTEGDDAGAVQEDVTLSTSGNLDVVDPDAGEAVFVVQENVADGNWGFFSIDETGEWTYNLNNSHPDVQNLPQGSSVERQITVESADGTTHTVTVTISGTNEIPEADDFTVTLSGADNDTAAVNFEPNVRDVEDDAAADTPVQVDILTDPQFGTLYLVEGDTRTPIDANSPNFPENAQIEYVLDDDVNEQLSFDASTDFKGQYANGVETEIELESGVTVSGGRFTGESPHGDSVLTPEELYFDNANGEKGMGVGDSELDVTQKDYIEVDFGPSVGVTSAEVSLGSIWGHYEDGHVADAQINIVLLDAEGNYIETITLDDTTNDAVYDGSGEFSYVITPENRTSDEPFSTIRIFTDSDSNPGKNSNVVLQGVEVLDAEISEKIEYQATDNDNADSEHAFITIDVESTRDATNDAPTIDVVANDFVEDADNVVVGAVAGTFDANDPEGRPITVDFAEGSNAKGHYSLGANGTVLLTAAGVAAVNAGEDLDPINLVVKEVETDLSSSDVDTPDVTEVNDGPKANPDAVTTPEDTPITIDVLANDTDEEKRHTHHHGCISAC